METSGIVLLHGYGVRGFIWAQLQSAIGDRLGPVATPDLAGESITDLMNKAKARIRRHSLECDAPVAVAGHSLGAVLAAIAARDLGPEIVSAVIMIAPPYGEQEAISNGFLRFLLKYRLIPPFLLRPRFFSALTPRSVQKAVFKGAVPENPAIQKLSTEPKWFHTDSFPEPLSQPALVIASPADRLVPVAQSEALAQVTGASTYIFDASSGVAHDDFFASPEIAAHLAVTIKAFLGAA